MPTKRDFYEVLGVSKTATAADLKSAYRKLALKFHPDRNKEPDAEATFKEINEAYQILSDTQKRQSYDQFGHAAFDPASGMGSNPFAGGNPFSGGGSGPFTWTYTTSGGQNPFGNMDINDPFEIFVSFFSGASARRPRYSLTVEFMEAVKGAEKKVTIEGTQRTIKIPPGATDGTRLRFDDFDITLDVRTHKRFKRDGFDLFIDQDISFPLAALGGEIQVETIDNTLKMKVRPGTHSHTLIRLRGEGVQHLNSRGKGDLYVRLVIKVPEKLNREEKQLLQELQNLSNK